MAFSFHKEMDVDLIIQQKLVGHLLGNVYFGMNGMEHSHCIVHLPQSIIVRVIHPAQFLLLLFDIGVFNAVFIASKGSFVDGVSSSSSQNLSTSDFI